LGNSGRSIDTRAALLDKAAKAAKDNSVREKELRLALVCYGGISLAVYMHGITKEVWKLTRASRAFHDHGADLSPSEQVYADFLAHIAQAQSLKLRVLTDIVTGASAGGINGIFLAQAIATGQSLEPLTQMWLDRADVDELLDPDARPLGRLTKFWAAPIAWFLTRKPGGTVDTTVAAEARDEVRAKLGRFVRARWFEPPFGGPQLSNMIIDALDAMAKGPKGPELLPPEQPLDLAVTVTDFRGHPEQLRLNSPAEVTEQEHRLIIRFRQDIDQDQTLGSIASLTFAARATSSFPGAFPPLNLGEMDDLLSRRGLAWPDRANFLNGLVPKGVAPQDLELVDGSVLANAPFQAAIKALPDRPARREVDRRFVFVDPKPGIRAIRVGIGTKRAQPGFFGAILGSLSDLPREQPIRDNLEALHERSRHIRRFQHIIDAVTPEVEAAIGALFGRTFFLDTPTVRRVAAWRAKAHERASADASFAYSGYAHLKLSSIVEGLADLAVRIANMDDRAADQFRQALWAEIKDRGIDQIKATHRKPTHPSVRFFQQFDLGFRIRRLRFLAREITRLIDSGAVTDAEMHSLRSALYEALGGLIDLQNMATYKGLSFSNPSEFLNRVGDIQALPDKDAAIDAALSKAFAQCPKAFRRQILLGYLGFAYFDIATLPMLQGEGLDEFNPIRVDRISPDDAQSIRTGGAAATLKGIELNSFGAFFSRKYRENDYLWGRLHGADRLIDIVASTAATTVPQDIVDGFKRALFTAILEEESRRLTAIAPLFETLSQEIAQGPLAKTAKSA
jgi:patatin-related protein